MKNFKIAVLCGGISPERDVSLVSGKCVADALSKNFDVALYRLDENAIPQGISPETHIVFPAMHGDYGEDGTLQSEMEQRGFDFAGCGSLSSRVCMIKPAAKSLLREAGVPVPNGIEFSTVTPPSPKVFAELFPQGAIVKPADKGSSVGLVIANSRSDFDEDFVKRIPRQGLYMAEDFHRGREFSIGVLYGKACGIVEIIPQGGVYDFKRKYTKGSTRYEFPARISDECAMKMRLAAETAYKACSCRDFSRVDFILTSEEKSEFVVLEINTLPGMTPTSLLPKSASCVGFDFDSLCAEMLKGAIARH